MVAIAYSAFWIKTSDYYTQISITMTAILNVCVAQSELAGIAASTKQIADREGLSDSYVRHVVPLGLLAPAIVESICVGRQSVSLSAERLKDHANLPIEWDAQQQLLSD